jgi:hypothetical protein
MKRRSCTDETGAAFRESQGGGRLGEGIGRLHQDEGGAGDQVVCLQEPVDRRFLDKVALLVDE